MKLTSHQPQMCAQSHIFQSRCGRTWKTGWMRRGEKCGGRYVCMLRLSASASTACAQGFVHKCNQCAIRCEGLSFAIEHDKSCFVKSSSSLFDNDAPAETYALPYARTGNQVICWTLFACRDEAWEMFVFGWRQYLEKAYPKVRGS